MDGPKADFVLAPDSLHVWCMSLADLPSDLHALSALLDPEEFVRASRFRDFKEGGAYIVAHAAARILLGRYLRIAPEAIAYGYGKSGKPFIAHPHSSGLYFNVSRTSDFCVFAVAGSDGVGVDVEKRRALSDTQIFYRVLAAEERLIMSDLAPSEREAAFFTLWVRKEAFLKATGEGLTAALSEVDVSAPPHVRWRGTAQENCWLHDFSPAPGYAAALCAPRQDSEEPQMVLYELGASRLTDLIQWG